MVKSRDSGNWRTLLPAVLILILILAVSAALLREGRLRDLDIARLGSLEAANSIAGDIQEDRPVSTPAGSVIGWGIYSPEGSSLATWGTAPERLPTSRSVPIVSEETLNNRLRTIRYLSVAGPVPGGAEGGGMRGRGSGSRRQILIDWDYHKNGNPEIARILAVTGLTLLAVILLVMQQISARRIAAYRQGEEKQRRLVQLGLAARTLTHEIRNPLGILKAQQSLLKRTLPPGQENNLSVIADEIDRLGALTDKVREWLADPSGNPVIFDAARETKKVLKNQPWEIRMILPDPGPSVKMDPALFCSALENLVGNAVESQEDIPGATPPELILESSGRSVRIIIKDCGKGLPEGNTEDLYNPFFTTKTNGSGVGLALARQLIEAAGGTLRLENRSSGGVSAKIELPKEKTR